MSNDYFNHDNPLTKHTVARSAALNELFTGIAAGFDLLPDPDAISEERQTWAGEDTGAANVYVVTVPTEIISYQPGLTIRWIPTHTNTTASTLNVNGLGAIPIKRASGAGVGAGDLVTGSIIQSTYDGTNFRITGVPSESDVTPHTHVEEDIADLPEDLAALSASIASLASSLAAKANTADLAQVATTGAYSDLTGEPTGVENGATADQSDAEIETAYNNQVAIVLQADAEAGAATVAKRWTAERVRQAILAVTNNLVSGLSNSAIEAITSGTYTLDGDNWDVRLDGTSIEHVTNLCRNATPANTIVITVPVSDVVSYPGARFVFIQDTDQTGIVSFTPESGGTINGGTSAISLVGAGSVATLICVANSGSAPEYHLIGNIRAAQTVYGLIDFEDGFVNNSQSVTDLQNTQSTVGMKVTKVEADQSATTTSTLADIADLTQTGMVLSTKEYWFKALINYRSGNATNGLKLAVVLPTVTYLAGEAVIPANAAGVGRDYRERIATSGTAVTAPTTPSSGTTYTATIEGTFRCSADGDVKIQYASEDGTNTITIMRGGMLRVERMP